MSRIYSSDTSTAQSLAATADPSLCIICSGAAAGVGPFSRHHLCQQHLAIDVVNGRKHLRDVNEELRPYSCGCEVKIEQLFEEETSLCRQLANMEETFAALQQSLNEWKTLVTETLRARLEAVQTCLRDLVDLARYDKKVREAEAVGNMAEVCELALSMQLSVPDLRADFERAQRLREESDDAELRGLQRLQRMVDSLAASGCTGYLTDAAVTACPEKKDAGDTANVVVSRGGAGNQLEQETVKASTFRRGAGASNGGQIVISHSLKLENKITWVTVCSDTSGFRCDSTGRVVPAESAGDGSVALPQQCLVTKVCFKDHLTVLSVDGTVSMRIEFSDANWRSYGIYGLHSDRQLLYIAHSALVTVMDLSGRVVRRILRDAVGFGSFCGIGGNAATLFVSWLNKIAAFSKATGQLETVITLSQHPDANLGNMTIYGNCLLVTDRNHGQVHRVRIDTQQLVTSHPTQRAGLAQFEDPADVATDSRGRLFISEFGGHSVRAVAADDGSLLRTLRVPCAHGHTDDRLYSPWGLAVVTGGPCEQLVVADFSNCTLLVLNLL